MFLIKLCYPLEKVLKHARRQAPHLREALIFGQHPACQCLADIWSDVRSTLHMECKYLVGHAGM